MKYLSPDIVKKSFQRLRYYDYEGKAPKERTSALMYFLAIDSVMKRRGESSINLDSRTIQKYVAIAYSELVTVTHMDNMVGRHVAELGKVECGGKDPESKIRSNFFSTQVKEGAAASSPLDYPRRPAPLLHIGPIKGLMGGFVTYHPIWKNSLDTFLSQLKTSTPYTDLAIFSLRSIKTASAKTNLQGVLESMLGDVFTDGLCKYWSSKIEAERKFSPYKSSVFLSERYVDAIAEMNKPSRKEVLITMSKQELVEIILKLEEERREN